MDQSYICGVCWLFLVVGLGLRVILWYSAGIPVDPGITCMLNPSSSWCCSLSQAVTHGAPQHFLVHCDIIRNNCAMLCQRLRRWHSIPLMLRQPLCLSCHLDHDAEITTRIHQTCVQGSGQKIQTSHDVSFYRTQNLICPLGVYNLKTSNKRFLNYESDRTQAMNISMDNVAYTNLRLKVKQVIFFLVSS